MGEENSKINGKFGLMVGDPLMGNITALIPIARGYPVQYPASTEMTKDTITGSADVLKRLIKQSAACPTQRFALTGYSQGAVVMHAAIADMPADVVRKVLAVVLYGDPTITSPHGVKKMPDWLYKRLQENCSTGDFTCDTSKGCHSDMARHLDYTKVQVRSGCPVKP
jgi:cutinase